jgi:hypothetical protein
MNLEMVINLHVCIRESICRGLCDGKKDCINLNCIESFIRIAAEIEKKYEAENGYKKTND